MSHTELLTRGVEEVVPQELAQEKLASGKKLRVYWGVDPTGTKIHLGHSIPLRKLQQFADAGHHAILLIGSFTAMIGDPSDKDALRTQLTREQVEANFTTYKEQASNILDMSKVEVRYNHEWLEKLTFENVVDLASAFTVQQMLHREKFRKRFDSENPIALHEFFYPLMQGYDSVALDVDCEIGGSDQLFNMMAGKTLMKKFGKRDKFVLTSKLIEGIDGRLMSKTYQNCIYLTDEPHDMYGKLMAMEDHLIPTYMECCTDLPMEEVAQTAHDLASGATHPKELKMRLAHEIVRMYHGTEAAQKAQVGFDAVFKDGGVPDDVQEVTVAPSTLIVDVMTSHNLAKSKGEARRLIEQQGVKMNDSVVDSIEAVAEEGILRVGKRRFLKICIS